MLTFGASFFPATAGTDFISGVTTVLTDNIGVVLTVFAFIFGVKFALRFFNKATKGRL